MLYFDQKNIVEEKQEKTRKNFVSNYIGFHKDNSFIINIGQGYKAKKTTAKIKTTKKKRNFELLPKLCKTIFVSSLCNREKKNIIIKKEKYENIK